MKNLSDKPKDPFNHNLGKFRFHPATHEGSFSL